MWHVPEIWEGGSVWILGGGPSITKIFNIPDKVVFNTIKGKSSLSEYSKYMLPIHDKHVIGINIAFKIGDWMDMVFFGDNNFFLQRKTELSQWKGLKVSCATSSQKHNWVKYTPQDGNKPYGITNDPRKVSWNKNSGAAAISIAAHTGAKKIFLLGFDMKLSENTKAQHFHGEYLNEKKEITTTPRKNLPFYRHLKGFPAIKRDAENLGIDIYNVNLNSAITEFPKITLKEALQLC